MIIPLQYIYLYFKDMHKGGQHPIYTEWLSCPSIGLLLLLCLHNAKTYNPEH